jgi:hypothetical protein
MSNRGKVNYSFEIGNSFVIGIWALGISLAFGHLTLNQQKISSHRKE